MELDLSIAATGGGNYRDNYDGKNTQPDKQRKGGIHA
jgi:hypothetical protein